MKTLSFWKKPLYSALIFFGTLIVLSVGYSAWNATMSKVSSGNPLSAAGWNTLVDNIADIDSRWSRSGGNIAFTGGNVGIGTVSPQSKLEVRGSIALATPDYTPGSVGSIMTIWMGAVSGNTYASLDSLVGGATGFGNIVLHPTGNGNVGIGTTTPTERLDIGGGNIKMGWERITNTCSNSSPCIATCTVWKMATGGSCLITWGVWTRIENSASDNAYTCYFEAPQPTVVATVYCANIR